MGYKLARFVSEIDGEFCCSICTMVLENSMQSPCEHIFCHECIKDWLKVESTCPIDRCALAIDDIIPTPRYFRNLLDKMQMKCSFESKGCQSIVPLEHQQDHLTKCMYNPNSEEICDKGCNIKMARFEYEDNNCLVHLTNKVNRQEAYFENIISRQAEKISQISDEMIKQREEISKLNVELNRIRGEETTTESVTGHQHGRVTNFVDNSNFQLNSVLKWRVFKNMKTSIDQPHIMEFSGDNPGSIGFAQQFQSLAPSNSSFKIRILDGGVFNSQANSTENQLTCRVKAYPPRDFIAIVSTLGSIGYLSIGVLYDNKKSEKFQIWKFGDVIECRIKFPSNFVNDGNNSIVVNFSINQQLITEKVMTMPLDGFFPTIFMHSAYRVTQVEYLSN